MKQFRLSCAVREWARSRTTVNWIYKGIVVFGADRNGSGIRWYARNGSGLTLRADTKAGMRRLITDMRAQP